METWCWVWIHARLCLFTSVGIEVTGFFLWLRNTKSKLLESPPNILVTKFIGGLVFSFLYVFGLLGRGHVCTVKGWDKVIAVNFSSLPEWLPGNTDGFCRSCSVTCFSFSVLHLATCPQPLFFSWPVCRVAIRTLICLSCSVYFRAVTDRHWWSTFNALSLP